MDTADIQKRIDAMIPAMLAKGLAKPDATVLRGANETWCVMAIWLKGTQDREYNDRGRIHSRNEDLAIAFDEAEAAIAALPGKDEARLRRFMDALGGVIDLGRETGIEVEFLNPLTESMKKLSENALTYQRQAAE